MDVTFFWIAFWLYFVGFLFFTLFIAFKARRISQLGSAAMILGFLPHTAALVLRWVLSTHPPSSNMYEYMSLMSWTAVLAFIFVIARFKKAIVGAFVAPVTFMLMVSASLLPKDITQQLMPALQSIWLQIHVFLAAAGEGAFAVAFGVSIMYLVGRRLESSSMTELARRFPSLELLDEVNYKAISIGFPLFTIGALFAGAIWAHYAWGSFWSWDPKETGSLIIWLFYAVYLHARRHPRWQGTRAAWMSILGFIMALLSFFANMVVGGQHGYT